MDKWNWGESAYLVKSKFQIIWKSKRFPVKEIEKYTSSRTDIKRISEVGCGGGSLGLCFVAKGYDVIFTDYSEQMLHSCRNNIAAVNEKGYREKLSCQNMFALGIKDNSVDLVFSDGVYEHIHAQKDRLLMLSEQRRILKKNGAIAVIIPNNKHPLVNYWRKKKYPWYDKGACPDWEIALSSDELAGELKMANFDDVYVDGCRVYEMIDKWPLTKPRHFLMNACKLLLPEWNRPFRVKYGTYLFALGRKQ